MKEFISQFHPLLVHLPIGFFLIGLLFFLLQKRGLDGITGKAIQWVLLFTVLATLGSAITGWLLADGGGYDVDLVTKHRNGGIALLIISAALWWLYFKEKSGVLLAVFWGAGTVILTLTGHWGGSLTHGEDFLSFGSSIYQKPEITNVQQAQVYKEIIEPIFAEKCWSCHSSKKQKGDLRLDSPEAILKGGENGEILVAHKPDQSELYRRLLLEKDEDDHMPPDGKPQLTKEEVKLVKWWIATGLSFDKKAEQLEQSPELKIALNSLVKTEITPAPIPDAKVPEPKTELFSQIRDAGFSIQKIAQDSPYLSLSLTSVKVEDDDWEILLPVTQNIIWLRGNNQELGQQAFDVLMSMENLTTVDLSQSKIASQNLHFSKFQFLERLNLSATNCSITALETLKGLENLKKLYLFNTPLSESDKEHLKALLPKTSIEFGGYEVPTLEGDTVEFTQEMLTSAKEL